MGLFSSMEEKIRCHELKRNRVHYAECQVPAFARFLFGFPCDPSEILLFTTRTDQASHWRIRTLTQNQTQETWRKWPFTRHLVNRRHRIQGAHPDREATVKTTDKCSSPYEETFCCCSLTCFSKHLLNAYILRAGDSQIKKKWLQSSKTVLLASCRCYSTSLNTNQAECLQQAWPSASGVYSSSAQVPRAQSL